MFGFGKKKRDSLDIAFDKTFNEIKNLDSWNDPKKLERYILDSCEQIVSTTKEIEAEKKEYRIVTNYLKDIETLENMPEDEREKLKNLAAKLVELTKARNTFESRETRISDRNYTLMEEKQAEVPSTIERLTQNEIYQDSLNKDMQKIQGEKSAIEIERDMAKHSIRTLNILTMVVFTLFGISLISLMVLDYTTGSDTKWYQLFVILFFATAFTGLFLRNRYLVKRRKYAVRYLNKVIPILNGIKMKYANITNAVNYVYSNYNIASSRELEYIWENYQIEKRDRELYEKNNIDMELCDETFLDYLKSQNLYDSTIWTSQAKALVDREEMAEVRHRLVQRRQKIRDQINSNTRAVKLERDEIDRIMKEHNFYVPEIIELIQSVDKLCGLNQYKTREPGAESGRQRRN